MTECVICGRDEDYISSFLRVCKECIKEGEGNSVIREAHTKSRENIDLPPQPPTEGKIACKICANHCQPKEGEKGYCGLSENVDGKIEREVGTQEKGLVSYYPDPHPTNCVASGVCAGGSQSGYPTYSVLKGVERGYSNAALFTGTCSFDCLYCQNVSSWHPMIKNKEPTINKEDLVGQILNNKRITCCCWFGGSPEVQSPFVYSVSKDLLRKKEENRSLRICVETNGNFSEQWLEPIAELCLESGGGIKYDLKAWDPNLNQALSGVNNKAVYRNFKKLGEYYQKTISKYPPERKQVPFLRASTLLVPGYIDVEEVGNIASFIASVDKEIPYSLLAFFPQYEMRDIPCTEKDFAYKAKREAEQAGLENVRVGNRQILDAHQLFGL